LQVMCKEMQIQKGLKDRSFSFAKRQ
jgi:hypothetical protein